MELIKTTGKIPIVQGITLDTVPTQILDDGFFLTPKKEGGWILTLSFVNVPHHIKKDSKEDKVAQSRGVVVYDRSSGETIRHPMLPSKKFEMRMSLGEDEVRRAITIELSFDSEADLEKDKTRLYESFFLNQRAFTDAGLKNLVKKGDPHIQSWIDFFVLRRTKILQRLDDYARQKQGLSLSEMPKMGAAEASKVCFRDISEDMMNIVGDIKSIARNAVTEAFQEYGLVGMPLVKPEYGIQVMKRNAPCLSFAEEFFQDVVSLDPKIGITKTIRDYGCLLNMRVLNAYLRNQTAPYTADEIEGIKGDYLLKRQNAEMLSQRRPSAKRDFAPSVGKITDYAARVDNVSVPMTVLVDSSKAEQGALSSIWGVGLTPSRALRALKRQLERVPATPASVVRYG
ncbi:MAG: hypothetical protein CMH30_04995 [Micavibrio sp.]|nr:hypothetical protein [Micavibrio sp.]|tara:strand:- start:837 stop:2033 length:1197 start_codon:yes stop_codon:yes gene_type:complete